MSAIETHGLTKRFRQLRGYRDLVLYPLRERTRLAVDGIDLKIAEGELFGLLGENGAGKTTLIRMLSTTLIPTAGTAQVGGHDVLKEAAAIRRLIGVVSGDERTFYWRLTGRQNLEFFAALYHVPARIARARIDAVLETLGATEYADERFDSYSTGTRQKFAIARGLLTQPHILFLDEPTRALDPIAAQDLRRYIVEHIVGRLGTTVLMATHTLSEAESICNRVAIVRRGRLVAEGSMSELTAGMALARALEVTLLGRPEGLADRLATISDLQDLTIEQAEQNTRLAVRLGPRHDAVNDVLRALLESGAVIESSTTLQPTLDDIYRNAHVD